MAALTEARVSGRGKLGPETRVLARSRRSAQGCGAWGSAPRRSRTMHRMFATDACPVDNPVAALASASEMTGMVVLGVFLPVTNNGWIFSKTSPKFLPTFALNRDICAVAER